MGDVVLFDTREAAAAWGVSIRTVERWVKAGHARPAKSSGGWVFTGEEVARVGREPRPRRGRRRTPPQPNTLPDAS